VSAAEQLVELSQWVDAHLTDRDPEAVLWGRVAKVGEEHGEVIAALIGATGQNPRKGRTHGLGDVVAELLDTAIAALAAVEHIDGHRGRSIELLEAKIARVRCRALGAQQ
jgi:hypothetical protein